MEAKYGVLLVFGLVLLCVGVVGAPFRLSLSGGVLKEDWTSLSSWGPTNGVATVQAGCFHVSEAGRTSYEHNGGWSLYDSTILGNQKFTVEYRVKISSWGGDGEFYWEAYQNGFSHIMSTTSSRIALPGTSNSFSVSTDTDWHTWTWLIDDQAQTCNVYRDGNKLVSWSGLYKVTSAQDRLSIACNCPSSVISLDEDWRYIDAGLFPPTGGPVPTTGSIQVRAYYDSNGDGIGEPISGVTNVYAVGPMTSSFYTITDATNGITITSLTPGTYTVYGTNSTGFQKSVSGVQVTAGNTVQVQLSFGGSTPPPSNDFLKVLKDFLNSAVGRALFVTVGLAFTGGGGIGLYKGRKKAAPSSYF